MKKIFLCSLILFCNSAFADGCKNTLFLMGCNVDPEVTEYCTYCTSGGVGCAKQDMGDNDTATLPSKPSGGDKYCCKKDNKVYVYDSWNILNNQGFDYAYGTRGFGEKITVQLDDGYFAFPKTENVSNQHGQCKDDVYSDCPLNKKCENGVAVDCTEGKYCANGVEQDCPPGYKCVGGEKTACNTPGYYCEGGTEQKCPAGSYCTGNGHKQDCPAPKKSDEGADAKTDCFIDSETQFCDDANKCFPLKDIDTINTKIFIKN